MIGTSNKTELLLGYGSVLTATWPRRSTRSATSTRARSGWWRGASACPDAIVWKTASADLWAGQSDEAELGYPYATI